MVERRGFDLVWGSEGSSGELGDVERTVADVRRALESDAAATVRLTVGTRQFGESVLRKLEESELVRVTVILGASS